jgi:hypothetical protein
VTFDEVLSALKLGFKIKRSVWPEPVFIQLVGKHVRNQEGTEIAFYCESVLADDWIIIPEFTYLQGDE